MIVVVDYGMGNLRSVHKALEKIGLNVKVSSQAKEIATAAGLVVPGVGAFGDCIKNLKKLDLLNTIAEFTKSGKPYLGICLGMHILFETSAEAPDIKGLGIFKGTVKKFPATVKIPHMGWNQIKINDQNPGSKNLLKNIPDNSYVYFVHSYYPEPEKVDIIAAETDYDISFASLVSKDNVWAAQFHPEKSQQLGLQILKNFGELCS